MIPGLRFMPTQEELLMFFLKNKATGTPIQSKAVIERDLYGDQATPWKIFDDDDPWETVIETSGKVCSTNTQVIYVITKLLNVGNGENHKLRTAGCGTWHGSAKPRSIQNEKGETIGTMRMLTFKSKSEPIKGHWIMHEYVLAGIALEGVSCKDYVICRISRRDVDLPPRNSVGDQEIVVSCDSSSRTFEGLLGKRKSAESGQESSYASKKLDKEVLSSCEGGNDKAVMEISTNDYDHQIVGSSSTCGGSNHQKNISSSNINGEQLLEKRDSFDWIQFLNLELMDPHQENLGCGEGVNDENSGQVMPAANNDENFGQVMPAAANSDDFWIELELPEIINVEGELALQKEGHWNSSASCSKMLAGDATSADNVAQQITNLFETF